MQPKGAPLHAVVPSALGCRKCVSTSWQRDNFKSLTVNLSISAERVFACGGISGLGVS
jgi:hypothetical protein